MFRPIAIPRHEEAFEISFGLQKRELSTTLSFEWSVKGVGCRRRRQSELKRKYHWLSYLDSRFWELLVLTRLVNMALLWIVFCCLVVIVMFSFSLLPGQRRRGYPPGIDVQILEVND